MNINSCTFIGHKDCPISIYNNLYETIKHLIVKKNVQTFYVGCNGAFDYLVITALKSLSDEFDHIKYYIVLSYFHEADKFPNQNNTIYPEGIEYIPYRFAIVWRNKWMINKCDYVLCYVKHTMGSSVKFYEYAKSKNKKVINLADSK